LLQEQAAAITYFSRRRMIYRHVTGAFFESLLLSPTGAILTSRAFAFFYYDFFWPIYFASVDATPRFTFTA